jgi:hypothetical protein
LSGRIRSLAANAVLAITAAGMSLVALEVAFRLFPETLLPAGNYGAGVYDPELGMNVHGVAMVANKVSYLRREFNRDGFLDIDHEVTKPLGVTRVGIFGDSYVQAVQVPLETVFVRQLQDRLGADRVETFGFGISGWGTLHATLAHDLYGDRYDMDVVIYAFFGNDPGDQIEPIAMRVDTQSKPFGELTEDGPGYRIRPMPIPAERPLWFRIAKWFQAHVYTAQVVRDRAVALRNFGIRTRADREMASSPAATDDRVPTVFELPATWGGDWAQQAADLGELILADFAARARARDRHFAVFYIPRGEDQLAGRERVEDSWKPWLQETCHRLGVPFIDPSDALRARMATEPVYEDHWTPAGHEVVAAVLADYLEPVLEETARATSSRWSAASLRARAAIEKRSSAARRAAAPIPTTLSASPSSHSSRDPTAAASSGSSAMKPVSPSSTSSRAIPSSGLRMHGSPQAIASSVT